MRTSGQKLGKAELLRITLQKPPVLAKLRAKLVYSTHKVCRSTAQQFAVVSHTAHQHEHHLVRLPNCSSLQVLRLESTRMLQGHLKTTTEGIFEPKRPEIRKK
jgi:hypothetical protein